MAEIPVKNEELRSTREAMRELTAILDLVESGQIEKIVLTQRGKMRGVLISVERYALLTSVEKNARHLIEALEKISKTDYRGPRPTEQEIAADALSNWETIS